MVYNVQIVLFYKTIDNVKDNYLKLVKLKK